VNRNHLALFHAVALAGSISKGAAAVRVSQPAVSKQIADLERSLGVRLLNRLPRGCALTDAGKILAGYAQRMKTMELDAKRAIEEFRGLQHGRLALGASLTIGSYVLPGVLGEFKRKHPAIELQIEVANTHFVESALLGGTIELGLTEGPLDSDELDSEVFFEDELVAIAQPGHPLLNRKSVSAREMVREPIILREEGSGTRSVIERALRRRGLRFKTALTLASPEAIKNAVAAGMGIAIVPRLIIGMELKAGSLGVIPVRDLVIQRPLHMQRLKGRSPSPAIEKFIEMLRKIGTAPQPV